MVKIHPRTTSRLAVATSHGLFQIVDLSNQSAYKSIRLVILASKSAALLTIAIVGGDWITSNFNSNLCNR